MKKLTLLVFFVSIGFVLTSCVSSAEIARENNIKHKEILNLINSSNEIDVLFINRNRATSSSGQSTSTTWLGVNKNIFTNASNSMQSTLQLIFPNKKTTFIRRDCSPVIDYPDVAELKLSNSKMSIIFYFEEEIRSTYSKSNKKWQKAFDFKCEVFFYDGKLGKMYYENRSLGLKGSLFSITERDAPKATKPSALDVVSALANSFDQKEVDEANKFLTAIEPTLLSIFDKIKNS